MVQPLIRAIRRILPLPLPLIFGSPRSNFLFVLFVCYVGLFSFTHGEELQEYVLFTVEFFNNCSTYVNENIKLEMYPSLIRKMKNRLSR